MNLTIKQLTPFIILLLLFNTSAAQAMWGVATKTVAKISRISTNKMVLSEKDIIELSELTAKSKGTKEVGKKLGKLKLSDDVLEDTYMRIALHQGKITRKEAEGMYASLSGVPGFRTTLRKVTGNNPQGTVGHLNELMIAHHASKKGFKVVQIGERFDDGLKRGMTDIDVKLSKGDRHFIIEAKDYQSTTKIPMDKYRSDLDSLVQYKNKYPDDNTIPVVTLTNKPKDAQYLKRLQHEADKRDVQLIFGTPTEQVEKIKLLDDIL